MNQKKWGITADTIVATAAVTVALVALSVSIYEGMATRGHRRDIVRPALDFSRDINKEAEMVDVFIENLKLGLCRLEL